MKKLEYLLSGFQTTFVSNVRLLLLGKTPEKELFLEVVVNGVGLRVEVSRTLKQLSRSESVSVNQGWMRCQELLRVKCHDFGDGVGVVIETLIVVRQFDAEHGACEHHGINLVAKRFPEVWFDIVPVQHLIAI